MTGHVLGCLALLVSFVLWGVASVWAWGPAGLCVASVPWVALAVLLVDVEAWRR